MSELGLKDPVTVRLMGNVAATHWKMKSFEESVPLFEQQLVLYTDMYGLDHPDTLNAMANLGVNYKDSGNLEKAIPLLQQAWLAADNNNDLGWVKKHFWMGLLKAGRQQELHKWIVSDIEKLSVEYGSGVSPTEISSLTTDLQLIRTTLHSMNGSDPDMRDLSLQAAKTLLQVSRSALGDEASQTMTLMEFVAHSHWKLQQFEESIPLFEELLELAMEVHGADHSLTIRNMANLAVNYKDSGVVEKAIPLLEQARLASEGNSSFNWIKPHLFAAYLKSGRQQEVRRMIVEELEEKPQKSSLESRQIAAVCVMEGWNRIKSGDAAGAEELLRAGWEYRRNHAPEVWSTPNAASLLGEALLNQGQQDEAGDLLVSGYEGLKDTADQIPQAIREQRLSEALDRLIRLAEETDDQEQLQKWLTEKTDP